MGLWSEHVVPRITHLALGTDEVAALRRRALAPARGRVVELGYGSGANLPHYPSAVTGVLAVEPSEVARRLAAPREAASGLPVEHVGLDGESLPVADSSVDTVVSAFTFCTIPEPLQALAEVRRVLRPEGRLLFLEHGLAPDERTQRWQRRLEPLQRRVFAGCHLARPIDELVRRTGLVLATLEHDRLRGPRPVSPIYLGEARPAAS